LTLKRDHVDAIAERGPMAGGNHESESNGRNREKGPRDNAPTGESHVNPKRTMAACSAFS
jgi:hypothetical protein